MSDGVSRRFLHGLAALAAFILTAFGIIRLSIWMLDYTPSCQQPCRDLGSASDHPACIPVTLSLEAVPASTKAGVVTEVFFRVRLTNQSCYVMSVPAGGFIWYRDRQEMRAVVPFHIHIQGPNGEVRSNLLLSKIALYSDRPLEESELRSTEGARPDDKDFINLLPGDSLTSNSAILAPYRTVLRDQHEPDGSIATLLVRVPVPVPPSAVSPPPGFNVVDDLRFDVPGNYRVIATYGDAGEDTWLQPVHPLAHFVPRRFAIFLEFIDVWKGSYLSPYTFQARSNIVKFEVSR